MLKITQERIDQDDMRYPGLRGLIERWEAKDLPSCPHCASADTAEVSAGLVGISMRLAGATTKIRLLPNGHPADYFCNQCDRYFDAPDGPSGRAAGGITMPGKDVVEAIETPEGLQALCDRISAALGGEVGNDEAHERGGKEMEAAGGRGPANH